MNRYRELMRRQLLEEMYDSLSPEDKRTFLRLTIEDKGREEILQALKRQEDHIADVSKKISSSQTWLSDFSSNIAGNAVWDGLVWLGSRLLRKL